ncbi:hypothetical protein HUJ04_010440 [Dendroctonus ponderosae]|nr:hypothetical protein HUJ04_010440 [Dendroctonus ponderosae]
MSGKVPGNNDKNNDSDSEENSRGPPRSLALDLGDDCVYNVDANRLETQPNASGATGTQERSNPRRDENPFSFRHFLRDCSNGNKNYQSQGARPKVYRDGRSRHVTPPESPQRSTQRPRKIGEFNSALPDFVKLSKEELLEIIKDTKKGFNVAKSEENKNREGVMMGESSSAADEFNFDNYDQNDDDTAGVLGIASLADLPVGTDTTTAFLFESDDSDREDDVIKPTDNLLLVGHVMGDASVLEVHVYNELEESFYVHHDILLNAFPLCFEWLSFEAHRPNGNYCAVGSMSPVIEVWDLDIMNSPRPAYKLGQIASVRKNRAHIGHTDAVLALAGTSTGYVECFDCRKGKLWSFEAHTKEVTGLDISSQCPGLLVTASTETLKTWDFSDENMPKLVNERDFNIGNIQCLELCPDSRFTVAMGGDKKGNSLMVFNMLNIDPVKHSFGSRELVRLEPEHR